MKKIFAILISAVMVLSLSACQEKPKNEFEAYVQDFVSDFKKLDFQGMYDKTLDKYAYFDGMYKPKEPNNKKIFKAMADNLEFEITSSEQNGDEATVKAHVSNINTYEIMNNIYGRLMTEYMTPGNTAESVDASFDKIVEEELNNTKIAHTDVDTVYNFVKDDKGNWTLESNVGIYDDLCGGYLQYQFEKSTLGAYSPSNNTQATTVAQ